MTIAPAPRPDSGSPASAWASRICAYWRASVEAIIEVGRLLADAKKALPRGDFGTMIESSLPFTASTAQRLMAIAADPKLSNAAHVQHLPPAWGTLYELTKLTDQQFETAIADGLIRPDMERSSISQRAKELRRTAREADLGAHQQALPNKRYGVILADPEWRFEPWSRTTGMDRSPDNHYPTSCTEAIAARDVASIAADDCILFLWATAPMLPHALLVMSAWGFDYKSHCVWIKDRVGTGYWFRNQHELLLIGTKGNIPAPAMGEQWVSTFEAPLGEHSQKPEIALQMIETYFPTLPKIELNRRGPPRKGWDAWGNETVIPIDPQTGEILDTPSEAA